MTDRTAIRGTLLDVDGSGVVRLEGRYLVALEDLWAALTDPDRLGQWLGSVEGDLRVGAEFRGHWLASGWEGVCRVEVCDPSRRILLHTSSDDADEGDGVVEVTLRADGDTTVLVLEDRGVPVDQAAAYAAGDQVHLEDLAAHLAGRERCDARARWQELFPAYVAQGVQRP